MRLPRLSLVACAAALCCLVASPSVAQARQAAKRASKPAAQFPLTIPNIMHGAELTGYAPSSVMWSLDGKTLFYRWKEASEPRAKAASWYAVDVTTAKKTPRKITEDEASVTVPPDGADKTRDGKRIVFSDDNDLWMMEAEKPGRVRLTDTASLAEFSPRWTRDEKHVTYTSGGNLFKMAVDGNQPLTQLTDIRTGSPPPDAAPKPVGVAKIARDGELELFGVVRDRAEARETREAERKADRERKQTRKPFYLPTGTNAGSVLLSPDETQVLVFVYEPAKDAPGGNAQSVVPQWVTESGYVEAPQGRPNVGGATGRSRCVLLDTQTGAQTPVTPPDALAKRGLFFKDAKWSEPDSEGGSARLVVLAEAADFHDHYLFIVDRKTGQTTTVHDERDAAWVDGPGVDQWGWMPDNAHLWLCTEQSGFCHIATVDTNRPDAPPVPLTSGKFEAFAPHLSQDKTALYFTSSESDLGERRYYKVALTGGARTPVVALQGISEDMTLSPDETRVAFVNSYTNRPPELFVQNVGGDNGVGKAERLTASPSAAFLSHPWRDVPIVVIPARDGFGIHARLFTPTGPKRKRAGVLFIHGAGYLQNANRGWSYYSREYMFSHLLAAHGYTVLDVDYRGSAGYGRDFRTGIYKNMGGKDLDDVTDAARWMAKTQNVDPARIGCWGGSYGGFLTLMALFKEPNTFACGAALRPVTDWTKYNHGYTAPILGLPQDDLTAYKRSSPIYYASGLRGGLLICHGMLDDNVFFQDSVRLTQKLIELGKDDWEIAPYPVEQHGFTEPSSWTDEYKRIYRLFESHLQKP